MYGFCLWQKRFVLIRHFIDYSTESICCINLIILRLLYQIKIFIFPLLYQSHLDTIIIMGLTHLHPLNVWLSCIDHQWYYDWFPSDKWTYIRRHQWYKVGEVLLYHIHTDSQPHIHTYNNEEFVWIHIPYFVFRISYFI